MLTIPRRLVKAGREHDINGRILTALTSPGWYDENLTRVSYQDHLRAARSFMGPLLPALGCSEAELRALYLILLPVNAVIYRGDRECEDRFRTGCPTPAVAWRFGVEEILTIHGLHSVGTRTELDNLERYALEESRIMRGDVELTEDLFRAVCYRRSSDIRLLVRLACQLLDRPVEGFLRLMRPILAWEEVRDDLGSYERDVREDSFNTLRIFATLYGADRAHAEMVRYMESLIREALDEMARADRADVARVWAIALRTPHRSARAVPRAILLRQAKRRVLTFTATTRLPEVIAEAPYARDGRRH
jgi:hypothetical protein